MSNQTVHWKKLVWKYIQGLGLIIAIVAGVLNIKYFILEKKSDIVVAVGYNDFTWPELPDNILKYVGEQDFKTVVKSLKQLNKYSLLSSTWSVGIHNNGEKEAKSLNLYLPEAAIYRVKRTGTETKDLIYKEVIKISDIQPKESIYIVAWTEKNVNDKDIEQVYLTHSNGIASKTVYFEYKASWVSFIENCNNILLFLLCVLLAVFVWQIVVSNPSSSNS